MLNFILKLKFEETQRGWLNKIINDSGSTFLNDPVSLRLLNVHCTLDFWKAINKHCNLLADLHPNPDQCINLVKNKIIKHINFSETIS
jgi:hypothetical protein